MAKTIISQQENTVLGKITNASGRPLPHLKVAIYDVNMREWQGLADGLTNKEGKYELKWMLEKLSGPDVKAADIAIRVFTSVNNVVLFETPMDEVRFNASKREEVNIVIRQAIPEELVAFDFLVKGITFLAGKVAISDLQENKKNQDITFLSKELEVSAKKIEHLVVAHRLNKLSNIDSAFFYALFQKDTLLHNDFAKNLKGRFTIGIGVDDQTLLLDASLVDNSLIEADIKAAVAAKIVSTEVSKNVKRNLEILSQYRKKAEEYYQNEHQQKIIHLLARFFKEGKLQEIKKLFTQNKNDLNRFLEQISDPSFYATKADEKDAKTTIELGKRFGFGDGIIPLVAKSKGISDPDAIRNLAKLNKEEWVKEVAKARPDMKDSQLISTYASGMVRKLEQEFPTIAFAAQLSRKKVEVLKNQEKMVDFFNKNEDFNLQIHHVDLYLKEKKSNTLDNPAVYEELKSVQRIFRLVPNFSKTMALREAQIHSSQNIVAIGESRFVKEIAPKAGISNKEAKEIYQKAETKHTAAMLMVGDLQDSMSVMDIASFETTALAQKLEAVSKDFPNLKSLFKLVDTCECEHCRSVYSPAAYLVELLQFLDKRVVVAHNAKSILFQRRPELGEIDLGCANANTPVKYIDLVCEILEEAVSPDSGIDFTGVLSDGVDALKGKISAALLTKLSVAGFGVTAEAMVYETESDTTKPHYLRDKNIVCKIESTGGANFKVYRLRQTFGTAAALDAAPEYVNEAAYFELSNKALAFNLPFDLQHTEAKEYLARFDIDRADLMNTFQSTSVPNDAAVAAERLALTETVHKIITETPAPNNNAAQQLYWNVPAPGNVVDHLKQVNHFLDKTGLAYKELELLLKLKFIDKNGNLFVKHHDLTCDTAQKEIFKLDLDALDRIHRFLRLKKKTGWKFEVLNEIIFQKNLGNEQLNDACLIKAAQLQEISKNTKIKMEELIGFFGEIPHIVLQEDSPKPLYFQVFLNKAKNGVIHEVFLPENMDGTLLLAPYIGYISTCLQLKETDLEFLLPLLPNNQLNFSNLSYLFASARLIKKLKIKAEEFATLQKLSGIDFWTSPANTLAFLEVAENFKNAPLKATETQFLLNHEATNLADQELKTEKIEALLGKLKSGYQKIITEQISKFDPNLSAEEQKETLTATLSSLGGLNEADSKLFSQLIDSNWNFKWRNDAGTEVTSTTAAQADAFISNKLNSVIKIASITALLNPLNTAFVNLSNANSAQEAALSAIQVANILVVSASTPAELSAAQTQLTTAEANEVLTLAAQVAAKAIFENLRIQLVKAFLDELAITNIQNSKVALIQQTLSAAFKIPETAIAVILPYARLKQPLPGTDLISDLLTVPFDSDVTTANYPKQFAAVKLLHKVFVLISAFKIGNVEIEWFFKNNASPALGWFTFDSIPYGTGQSAISLNQYLDFAKIISYVKLYTPVTNPLDAENPIGFLSMMDIVLSGASQEEFFSKIALLTGYGKNELEAIDTHLFTTFDITHYANIQAWDRLLECAEFSRKLGATTAQIKKYISPTLTGLEVGDLRTTLKSRYDEDTWLSTLKEIMDAIRPQKRDALVAYLLATNPDMKDKNDLYEYFLVDVEMEACMPSSRIVQAHNSVQLFVQRCLMGLEPNAIADVDRDPNWNQWKWMRNYRVWEANRKVFLYPENWYDVTLTDDKTYLLTEFINEIQQNELTNDTAEDAFRKYLEKLDNIAFLEVMATWYDVPTRNMHVFARTKGGDPAIYYYRRFENERYWSPWEKLELDISGNHLLAFMRNNRLHLAWPMFSEVAKPEQESTIPPAITGEVVANDKPKKKLKIQLAISEYTNRKWQQKKVSMDSVLTPSEYTNEDEYFRTEKYNLIYAQITDQVLLFSSAWEGNEFHQINGIFDIAGCKGYPELVFEGNKNFPDFYPDFKDTLLNSQRYNELTQALPDNLAVRNGRSPMAFYEILNKTPGKFRISYPHQFTTIDLVALFRELFLFILNDQVGNDKRNRFKIPLGTLLPYFKEDSNHAYVVIPGVYKKVHTTPRIPTAYTLNDTEKRTASNVFQLFDDITNWFKKISSEFETNPPADLQTAFQRILTDSDFQNILKELSSYADISVFLDLLMGVSGDSSADEFLKKLLEKEPLKYGEQFKNMYHPLVCFLKSILYKNGIPALMNRGTQLKKTDFDFEAHYAPNVRIVPKTVVKNPNGTKTFSYPVEDIDFESDGSYSAYNWDLFFRMPLHLAGTLTQNQRFEEALTWFHYMFNPSGALPGTGVQKYWVTKPFYLNQQTDYVSQRIDSLLYATANESSPEIKELEFAISEWRNKPFRPDVVARFRPVAYQKALLMKYIDNLTEWGDYLFRQDTMESVAQATQMYILADKLLGPKPRIVPSAIKQPYETYNQMEAKIDSFGNALIELENILPDLAVLPEEGHELPSTPVTLSMLYFCIPSNEKMYTYWDRVADRLFKIRHCQNIDGIERSLALFAPPIDPGMLVRAAASGLDLSSVMAGLNAPTPYYRFQVLSQKATELAQEVRGLGNSLLQTLEKKDAETLSLLRSELEIKVLNAVTDIKKLQIKESVDQIELLKRTKKVTEERHHYYSTIQKIISKEQLNLDKMRESKDWQLAANITYTLGAALALIPDFALGVSGFGGSPHGAAKFGGSLLAHSTDAIGKGLGIFSAIASYEASSASVLGGYDRRFDDWKLQATLAQKELEALETQMAIAEIRKEISEKDLTNHELQIENAKKTDEFMHSKFTNKELYDWMIGQVSAVYFKSYQLAHDFAKKAERCYRFELGNDDRFISYGYWDRLKKGLQSADHLIHDIKRMQTGYLDKNKREYEITKHVSLALLDPLALIRLRASGICDFEIPEVIYDMDHPGQYFRRLKSVSISLPCIAGPYTSVSAKLSLVNNRYRNNTNDPGNYAEVAGDNRFVYNVGAIQYIATSHAQNDSGMFELNFRDERYLPFENTGAISSWRLELPTEIRQFDYSTIADVIVHVKYTSREGGSGLRNAANETLGSRLQEISQNLKQNGLHIAMHLKHDLANEWHLLKKNGSMDLTIDKSRLPYMVQPFDNVEIDNVLILAKVKGNPAAFVVNVGGTPINLARENDLKLCKGLHSGIDLDTPFTLSISDVDKETLEALMLVVKYTFS